jgi:hypothetical protein
VALDGARQVLVERDAVADVRGRVGILDQGDGAGDALGVLAARALAGGLRRSTPSLNSPERSGCPPCTLRPQLVAPGREGVRPRLEGVVQVPGGRR